MTPEEAIARAKQRAEWSDFGAEGWKEGLDQALDAFARMPLNDESRGEAYERIVTDLANRLSIERWYAEHPRVEAQQIDGPLFVIGLPRTGTTATIGMLACDSRFRFLRGWEAREPVPPPIFGEEDNEPRAVEARQAARGRDQSRHISDPDGPEEDMATLAPLDMKGYYGAYPMPEDYIEWWMNADFAPTLAFHERTLKLLQSHCPPNLWLLKSPVHLFRLEQIAAQYPGAAFVWTHRDPAKIIPSVCSLQYRLNTERCEPGVLNKLDYGPRMLRFWSEGMARALTARARIGEDRFIDLWNDDIVSHPVRTLARLYGKLGFGFTDDLRVAIDDYAARNEKGAHGVHRYTPEEYGTTRDEIRWAFSDYIARFGL